MDHLKRAQSNNKETRVTKHPGFLLKTMNTSWFLQNKICQFFLANDNNINAFCEIFKIAEFFFLISGDYQINKIATMIEFLFLL